MGVDFRQFKMLTTVNHKMYASSQDKDNHTDYWFWLVWKPKRPNLLAILAHRHTHIPYKVWNAQRDHMMRGLYHKSSINWFVSVQCKLIFNVMSNRIKLKINLSLVYLNIAALHGQLDFLEFKI